MYLDVGFETPDSNLCEFELLELTVGGARKRSVKDYQTTGTGA